MGQLEIVFLGLGVIPLPPGDEAAGVEEFAYRLATSLTSPKCQVHMIDIVGGPHQNEERRKSNIVFHQVKTIRLPPPRSISSPLSRYIITKFRTFLFAFQATMVLIRLLRLRRIDIIHAHIGPLAVSALMARSLAGASSRVVLTSHYGALMRPLTWRNWLFNATEILPMRWVDHLVVNTPSVQMSVIAQLRLKPGCTSVITTPAGLTDADVAQTLRESKSPHASFDVLCAGTINRGKNQFALLKAVPTVVSAFKGVRFIFCGAIGDVHYYDLICDFVARNNLSNHVIFKGMVSRRELFRLYAASRIFAFVSTVESQGVVLLEAMAFGLPVIASDIQPIIDVVKSNHASAILVNPSDSREIAKAIIRVLSDEKCWLSMSQSARHLAGQHSWARAASEYMSLYGIAVT